MASSKQTKTVHIDPHGDLQINVVTGVHEHTTLLVSSKAMSAACEPWKVMLGPNFLEGQPSSEKVITFEDDDLGGLIIVMRIAHLQFNKVPATLSFNQLLDLAIVTDKYQATHLVIPWIDKWLQGIQHLADEDGYEELLWIAWEYGHIEIFRRIVDRLVMEVQIDLSGKCVNKKRMVFGAHMPPEILERICKAREAIIDQLLAIVNSFIEKFVAKEGVCKRSFNKKCDAASLGSLIMELGRLHLWPLPKAHDVKCRVKELAEDLKTVQTFNTDPHGYNSYGCCNFTIELKESVDKVTQKENMPRILLESHNIHLGAQKRKLKIDDSVTA